MRLFMKSFIPHNNPPSTVTPHVLTGQHYDITTLTHQLAFHSQQSLHHRSLNDFESSFLNHIHLPSRLVQPGHVTRLSDCWEEYMGLRDWVGLLDPLDKNLAHEILRYGNFIEAAYRAFDFDPASPTYGSCKFQKKSLLEDCGVPGGGYRITRHLRATSGLKVPEWARCSWAAMQTSWIGFVAVSNEKAVIDKLGRREVVIALRGTATCLEWLENLRATLAPVLGVTSSNFDNVVPWNKHGPPMVESGFLSLYTSSTDLWPSLQYAIRKEVSHILEAYKDEPLSITITGHSLGAALATLAAYDIKTTFDWTPLVTVISFGGPRVGNQSFRTLVDRQGTKILRVVNPSDLITKVPGFVTDNNGEFVKNNKRHTTTTNSNNHGYIKCNKHQLGMILPTIRRNKSIQQNSSTISPSIVKHKHKSKVYRNNNNISIKTLNKENMFSRFIPRWILQPPRRTDTKWWAYAEVGHELRLESEEVDEQLPYKLDNMNVAKCHDLKTYLNLVEGCPLKALVKRSLKKLTHRCCNNCKNKGSALAV